MYCLGAKHLRASPVLVRKQQKDTQRKVENRHDFLPVPSSLCLCPNCLLCFPSLQGPSWLFRNFSIRALMLDSAGGMSNRDLERERPRIELNSHPGCLVWVDSGMISQSPRQCVVVGTEPWGWAGGGGRGRTMCPNLFIVGTLVGSWFSHGVGIILT